MTLLYTGGNCNRSYTVQIDDPGLFECEDFPLNGQVGPPTEPGTVSFIQVLDKNGEFTFRGFVNISDTLLMDGSMTEKGKIGAESTTEIFDNEGGTLLQRVRWHSSCSANLFLKDRFGAVQLVEFMNEEQGLISCFAPSEIAIPINIPIVADDPFGAINVTTLTSLTNLGPQDLTDQVAGQILVPGGDPILATINVTLDLTQRTPYVAFTTVTGVSLNTGSFCSGSDTSLFVIGNTLPPTFPSIAPTPAPTRTAFPTVNPADAVCDVQTILECDRGNGGFNQLNCDNLAPPAPGTQCNRNDGGGDDLVSLLQFRFKLAGNTNCPVTDPPLLRDCSDEQPIPGGSSVFIRVEGKREIFFEGEVERNGIVELRQRGGITDRMDVFILDPTDQTTEWQTMEFEEPECVTGEGIVLGNPNFGALELIGFSTVNPSNFPTSYESLVAELTVSYVVLNVGQQMMLNSVITDSTLMMDVERLTNPPVELERRERLIFQESTLINLNQNVGQTFSYSVFAEGEGSQSRIGCNSTSADSFTVMV